MSAGKVKRGVYESVIESYLKAEVERCGGMCLKLADKGRKGFPDRTVIWPAYGFARVHFVELKTIGGKLDPAQVRYHADLRNKGAVIEVLWTKGQVDEYVWRFGVPPF